MNPIPMTPVRSSHLKSIGFDERTGTLAIQFREGGTYFYHGISGIVHADLMNAPSKGRYFRANIRSRYKTTALPK